MGYTPPYLEVRKITGGYSVYSPSSTSTDDLKIYSNLTDATSYIVLEGLGGIRNYMASGATFYINDGSNRLAISYTSPDTIIENPIDTKNIFLKTTGTGVVKFGTYTAGAATDSTGYISILDAAGNARKLMVQA